MLTNFSLSNFRSFSEKQNISLKPITLIYGANSSGKSSLLKSMLLMKQTIEETISSDSELVTKGQYTDIGNFKDFIYKQDTKNEFSIRFDFNSPKNKKKDFRWSRRDRSPIDVQNAGIEYIYGCSDVQTSILKRIKIYFDNSKKAVLELEQVDRSMNSDKRMRFGFRSILNDKNQDDIMPLFIIKDIDWSNSYLHNFWETNIKSSQKEKDMKNLKAKINKLEKLLNDDNPEPQKRLMLESKNSLNNQLRAYKTYLDFLQSDKAFVLYKESLSDYYKDNGFLFYNFLLLEDDKEIKDELTRILFGHKDYWFYENISKFNAEFDITQDFAAILYFLSKEVRDYLRDIKYLGALRENPVRYYLTTPNVKNYVGKSGKNTIDIIARNHKLEESINKQLENLDLGYTISPKKLQDEDIYLFLLNETKTGMTVSLSDVGFGVSQILPVLVQSMLSNNETILIEQPEIHIHPKLQAELGSLFAECIKEPYNNRFIIETHSENIILRLQKLIRKGFLNSDDVAVIYVDKTENGAICYNLRIDEKGKFIDKWPNGFFEESFEEMFG